MSKIESNILFNQPNQAENMGMHSHFDWPSLASLPQLICPRGLLCITFEHGYEMLLVTMFNKAARSCWMAQYPMSFAWMSRRHEQLWCDP